MGKSFYDPDYKIEIGEKRVEQYTSSYQMRDGQIPKLVIIYSCLGIYFLPILRDLFNDRFGLFSIMTVLFWGCLCISCIYALRLFYPREIRDLKPGDEYYLQMLEEMEKNRINASMAPWEVQKEKMEIDEIVKGKYLKELELAQEVCLLDIERKKYLYQKALLWAILAIIPYLFSVFNHIILKK